MNPEPLLTREELARAMRSSTRTVDRMKAAGMPFVPWGRRGVRFRLSEALTFAESYYVPEVRFTAPVTDTAS